tara:strand:+ start:1668 stop:1910 length:243 start_codon:yes stop_codon:yes gene_type:complete
LFTNGLPDSAPVPKENGQAVKAGGWGGCLDLSGLLPPGFSHTLRSLRCNASGLVPQGLQRMRYAAHTVYTPLALTNWRKA